VGCLPPAHPSALAKGEGGLRTLSRGHRSILWDICQARYSLLWRPPGPRMDVDKVDPRSGPVSKPGPAAQKPVFILTSTLRSGQSSTLCTAFRRISGVLGTKATNI